MRCCAGFSAWEQSHFSSKTGKKMSLTPLTDKAHFFNLLAGLSAKPGILTRPTITIPKNNNSVSPLQ